MHIAPRTAWSRTAVSIMLQVADIPGSACLAAEFYVASVLAVYNQSGMTDSIGRVTFAEWHSKDWHPRSFLPGNATETVHTMRMTGEQCATT